MNDDDFYNPFEDQKLRTVKTSLPEVYDQGSAAFSTKAGSTVHTDVIDDYEPFSNDKVVLQLEGALPSEAKTAATSFSDWNNDIELKTQITEEKERQQTREPENKRIERIKNFPPFPICCPIKPCFYQDIDIDIPEQCRSIVKMGYALWIFYCMALLLNVIGTLVVLIVFSNDPALSTTSPTLFGVSLLLLLLFIPLSYLFWFRRLYFAFKTDSSIQFFIFFIIFALYIISLIIEIIGIPQCGVCGWILVIMTRKNTGVMIFMVIVATSFTCLLLASIYLLLKVNLYFRSSGGSISKAKSEIGSEASSSTSVKSVIYGLFTSAK